MPLSVLEQKAVSHLVSRLNHNSFRLLLARDEKLPALEDFSSMFNPMPTVAFDFVYWLGRNPQALVPLLVILVVEFLAAEVTPTLLLALARLRAAQDPGRPVQQSWEVALIEGVPVINRLRLRDLLQQLAKNRGPGVVLVDGPAGTGRSHSFYLINHVAASSGHKLVKMDIAYLPPDGRNLESIVGKLVRDLNLAGFIHPSQVGATPETVGWRYADNFAAALRVERAHTIWFVFDSLEKHPLAEVRAFVNTLIELLLGQEIKDCVFFLLGAGPDYLRVDDLLRIETDPLGIFSQPEIELYVSQLNELGTRRLEEPALSRRAREITDLLNQTPSHEVCRNISKKIAVLRRDVNA